MMKPLGHENDSEYGIKKGKRIGMEFKQLLCISSPSPLSLRLSTQFELQASKCSFAMLFGKQLATSNAH